MSSSSSSRKLRIGIIGFGTFAQFLASRMMKQSHTLSATSRSDYSQLHITFFREIEQFMDLEHDVMLICTSILSLSQILRSIPLDRLKKQTLFADVLSVKEHPKGLLLQVLLEESDVLCTHPMFRPESGKDGWNDLPFVYDRVRIRDEDICFRFLQIFKDEGCRMVEMSCEDHDKLAARSQFLTHTIGRVLAEMEIQSTSMDTRGFRKLLQLKESTVKNSFNLYSGLFIHNRFAKQELKNLELAVQTVRQKLLERMDDDDTSL